MATHDKDDDLTPEELEVLQILDEGHQRIEQLDNLINNPPPLSGPAPRPRGAVHDEWTVAKREQYKKMLEYQKTLVKADVKERAVKATEKSPLNIQLRAYEKVDKWSEQAPDDKKNIEERKLTEKDMSSSQDVSMRMLSKEKHQSKLTAQTHDLNSPDERPQESATKPMSMSMRFSTKLGYTGMTSPSSTAPEKSGSSRQTDINKD